MHAATIIDLAHVPDFTIGPLAVRPSVREVCRGEVVEIVEPRVMQVLVALAQARGAVVGRDDLIRSCWDGRIVGDDAVNRIMGRLRRLSEAFGMAFRVETITRVGYRLVVVEAQDAGSAPGEPAAGEAPEPSPPMAAPPPASRRTMIVGAGAAATAALLGAGWWWRDRADPRRPPAAVADLIRQADAAMWQADVASQTQGIGLFKEVTARAPDYADGWGLLAMAYAYAHAGRDAGTAAELRARAGAAAGRATAIEPGNSYARLAMAFETPVGQWRARELAAAAAAADHPADPMPLMIRATTMLAVGRVAEAADALDRAVTLIAPVPGLSWIHADALWSAGRLDEADRAIEAAFAVFPQHVGVWFTRFYMMLYTGRAAAAAAMADDVPGRPPGIPADEFEREGNAARALAARDPRAIAAACADQLAAARVAAGRAENAIGYLSATAHLDDAFALAAAFFFGRGFAVGDIRYSPEQASYLRAQNRGTRILFMPPCEPMRGDPRFAGLTRDLGLDLYWRQTGTRPDDRRGR